jgi:hypothetical protein
MSVGVREGFAYNSVKLELQLLQLRS